jgi:hypothetical protein
MGRHDHLHVVFVEDISRIIRVQQLPVDTIAVKKICVELGAGN